MLAKVKQKKHQNMFDRLFSGLESHIIHPAKNKFMDEFLQAIKS
jgi:hypothetical protein